MRRLGDRMGSRRTWLIALLAASCGAHDAGGRISYVESAHERVVTFRMGGGLGQGESWTGVPSFVLHGDGRVIFSTQPVNPSAANLREARLAPADIQALLQAARSSELLGESTHVIHPVGTDQPWATLEIVADRRCVSHLEYPEPSGGFERFIAALFAEVERATADGGSLPFSYTDVQISTILQPAVDCVGAPEWSREVPTSSRVACVEASAEEVSGLVGQPLAPEGEGGALGGYSLARAGDNCVAFKVIPLLPGHPACREPDPAGISDWLPGCVE